MKKLCKPVSILLSVILICSVFSILPVKAVAETVSLSYIDGNGELKTADQVEVLTEESRWLGSGWYAVTSDLTIPNRLSCGEEKDTTHIIICDGCTLNLPLGITSKHTYTNSNTLNIYGQSEGTGTIIIDNAPEGCAGIESDGTVTINGGIISAAGGDNAAGIGGGIGWNGNVVINGGVITAKGGINGAAIGGGSTGAGNVTINGGQITVVGYKWAGIGAGYYPYDSSTITLNWKKIDDFKVTVNSGGFRGTVNIVKPLSKDGAIIEEGKYTDFYNGSYNRIVLDPYPLTGYIDENGTAKERLAYNIGSDSVTLDSKFYTVDSDVVLNERLVCGGNAGLILPDGYTLRIPKGITVSEGKSLTVYGQSEGTGKLIIDNPAESDAGIGGTAENADAGTITICGGDVTVAGFSGGAGIGGGSNGSGVVNIRRGTVHVTGGENSIGVGGSGSTVRITGGTVLAAGKTGIGGNNSTIRFTGGAVHAEGGENGVGIGGDESQISMNWTDPNSFSVYADSYSGTVTLEKHFTDGETVYAPGEAAAGSLANKTLTPSAQNYSVTWKAYDGSVLKALDNFEYGDVLSYGGSVPIRPEDDQVYWFSKWTDGKKQYSLNESFTVNESMVFTPIYTSCDRFAEISYLDADGTLKNHSAESIPSSTSELSGGWYMVNSNVTTDMRYICSGEVHLVLCDGCTLTAPKGIEVNAGNSLTVYGQSEGTGALIVSNPDRNAGIGSKKDSSSGLITINGGTFDIQGGWFASGIGTTESDRGICEVVINGGTIRTTGGTLGCGIGGYWAASRVTINGGTLTARGGDSGCAIGGGENSIITVNGGEIKAYAGGDSYGIGKASDLFDSAQIILDWTHPREDFVYADNYAGGITLRKAFTDGTTVYGPGTVSAESINGKTLYPAPTPYRVTVTGSENGSVTPNWDPAFEGETVTLTVQPDENYGLDTLVVTDQAGNPIAVSDSKFVMPASNVTVTATFKKVKMDYVDVDGSTKWTPFTELTDGSYVLFDDAWYALTDNVTIDGRVICYGDVHLILCDGATLTAPKGITVGDGDSLTVYGQSAGTGKILIQAADEDYAGIGGLQYRDSGMITINGGTFEVTGGKYGAAIGGGGGGGAGKVVINGGTVRATGKSDGAGIGGGSLGNGNVTITGGNITAIGGPNGSGIGGGYQGSGNVTVTGGTVTATGGEYGAGIGGGRNDYGTVTITGGTVSAVGGTNGAGIGSGYRGNDSTIRLGWAASNSVSITADSYSNSVTITRPLTDGTTIYRAGTVNSGLLGGKTLTKPLNIFSVTWKNADGSVLETNEEVFENDIPVYHGAAPEMADGTQVIYTFKGWTDGVNSYALDETLPAVTGNVTYIAEFSAKEYFAQTEPYIDENGEYHLGNVEYVKVDGELFAITESGAIGEKLNDVSLSYFDFLLRSDDTYQITYYTGPKIDGELIIPKTFNGKPITVLGNNDGNRLYETGKTQFSLVLNENITEIRPYTFYVLYVTEVTGDTSNLKTIGSYAFSWANGPGGYKLDIMLDYPGNISVGRGLFNNMTVTARIKHATKFYSGNLMEKSIEYIFTDAHTYGDPEWTWADDYSTASARFTCTDSRCRHQETVDATVTSETKDGIVTYTATAEFGGNTYTDTKTAFADGVGASLAGHTISLDGDIAVNFYMELSDSIIAHKNTAYMHFTIPTGSGTTAQDMLVKDARVVESGDKTYYVFKCRVAAKEMTSEIKAQMIDGDLSGTVYTYSVKKYADYLIEHADEREDLAKAVPLVKAMLNYGAYAQVYFDKNPGTLANADLTEDEKALSDPTINIADPDFSNLPAGVTFEGATLSLKSETSLSLYFTSSEDLEFSCDGYTVEKATSGDYQIARIRGIKAKHIGDILTLKINGSEAVSYSPLNYCKNALEGGTTNENLQNVVKALYAYWQAADQYFD